MDDLQFKHGDKNDKGQRFWIQADGFANWIPEALFETNRIQAERNRAHIEAVNKRLADGDEHGIQTGIELGLSILHQQTDHLGLEELTAALTNETKRTSRLRG